MKKIDIGNPTFEKLITEDNVYVDKTRYLYNLLTFYEQSQRHKHER